MNRMKVTEEEDRKNSKLYFRESPHREVSNANLRGCSFENKSTSPPVCHNAHALAADLITAAAPLWHACNCGGTVMHTAPLLHSHDVTGRIQAICKIVLTLGNMSGSHNFIACAAVAGRSSAGIFLIHLLSSPENSSTDGRSRHTPPEQHPD